MDIGKKKKKTPLESNTECMNDIFNFPGFMIFISPSFVLLSFISFLAKLQFIGCSDWPPEQL